MAFWVKKGEEEGEKGKINGSSNTTLSPVTPTAPTAVPVVSSASVPPTRSNLGDPSIWIVTGAPEWSVGKPKVAWGEVESQPINGEDVVAERFGGKVRSVLGAGTVIQGKLSFDTPVRIDGKLSGEVLSSKAVIVGTKGEMNAEIDVGSLVVLGNVKGVIRASEKVEIFPGGSLEGDVCSPSFVIHGGVFNGRCVKAA